MAAVCQKGRVGIKMPLMAKRKILPVLAVRMYRKATSEHERVEAGRGGHIQVRTGGCPDGQGMRVPRSDSVDATSFPNWLPPDPMF